MATQVASILIHIKDNDSSLHVKQRIRGFVSSDFGGRAVLLAQLGGTTFLVNLSPFPSTKEDKNFFQEFESTVPPGIDYQATLFLLVERDIDNKEVSVLLSVDSLDIQIEQSDVEKK